MEHLDTTVYYEEFLRYHKMASIQQQLCNLDTYKHDSVWLTEQFRDPLMEQVHLYDVVNRKYAGFSQIVNDCFYGRSKDHPYSFQIEQGVATEQRKYVTKAWERSRHELNLEDWLYVFIVHRITGSGINYAKKPSGYNNTLLIDLWKGGNIARMVDVIKSRMNEDPYRSYYTSVGYQFPAFPKLSNDYLGYKKGGDYYLCELAPKLALDLTKFMEDTKRSFGKLSLRTIGDFMLQWNVRHNLKQYHFQYAAVVADIADWFPEFVMKETPFYYGSNARECIGYLANRPKGMKEIPFLDAVMKRIMNDTGSVPYDAEDICCDFIRWVENYVRPGGDYDHVDRDTTWSSCTIRTHPFGRQKAMLELGLVKSFNEIPVHPSDDYVISRSGISVAEYKRRVHGLREVA